MRLSQAALSCKIDGYNIARLAAMEVDEPIEVIMAIKDPVAAPMVDSLVKQLGSSLSAICLPSSIDWWMPAIR